MAGGPRLGLGSRSRWPLALLAASLPALGAGQQPFGRGFGGAPRLGNCPEVAPWPELLGQVNRAAEAFRMGDFAGAKEFLAVAAEETTRDAKLAFQCSLGISSLFRALAFAYCTDPSLEGASMRRANQIGLRFLHVAMNWLTHTFVSTNHDQALIDGSAWPIGIQEINDDLTSIANALKSTGPMGHAPTAAASRLPHDFRRPELKIAIVSLCAYPPEHVLPKFSMSNQGLYAERHGYTYIVEREQLHPQRPPAWGKVKLMDREVRSGKYDWVVWSDCDTYFMNMSVTIENVLFTYAGQEQADGELGLDPEVHMIVSEDAAMLNTGIFFVRSTDWVANLLDRVWGTDDSPWINHPWWENAAFAWEFLKDNPRRLAKEDQRGWVAGGEDDLTGVYPREVRLAPQSHFNSYHPITSRFLHDTWEEGKYVIAFNGVLSGSSSSVVQALYGTYYQTACQLNNVEDRCLPVDAVLPWDRR